MSASKYPTTKKSAPTTTNFSKGLNTYLPNDLLEYEQVRIAQNVRFDRIGEYKTRPGIRALTNPSGITTVIDTNYNGEPISVKDQQFDLSYLNTPLAGKNIYSMSLWLAHSAITEREVVRLNVWAVNTNKPDELIGTACAIAGGSTELTSYTFKFPFGLDLQIPLTYGDGAYFTIDTQAPTDTEWKIGMQAGGENPAGKVQAAPYRPIVGLFEANIETSSSSTHTFILHAISNGSDGFTVCSLNPNNTISAIFSGHTPYGKPAVRFSQNGNEVRVAYGGDSTGMYHDGAPKKLSVSYDATNNVYTWTATDITTEDLQTGTNLNIHVSNILTGTQDNIIYFDSDTNTQAVWTNPYGLEWAKGVDYTTTATIKTYVAGTTKTTIISSSTLTPMDAEHPASSIALGDIIVDENDNYGEVTNITGQNITVTSISHVATPINSYDKFDRDFRQNFPAIKTGDPLTAMVNLGGVIFFFTRHHKYYMISQTADVWTQQASSAQHGTFSQESVACDLNYAYFASDDGIYRFNGSSEESITDKTVQNLYDKIENKQNIKVALHGNRLYVFFRSSTWNNSASGSHKRNNSCLVYNINLKVWESLDTGIPTNVVIGRQTASNRLLCGSSAFGQIFELDSYSVPEDETGDQYYADFGSQPIDLDIATGYLHFGTPSQLHRITKWRPEFGTSFHSYKVRCGYALDFTDLVKYAFSIDLKDQTNWYEHLPENEWNTTNVNNTGAATLPTKLTTIPKVYNQFRRCQIRYQHHAAFEPVSFKSHTLVCQTQRIR